MRVILTTNIKKLGKIGELVKVKDGYARNYLIPKKKVLRANKENLKVFEEKKMEQGINTSDVTLDNNDLENDDDDMSKVVGDIEKALSNLSQAEVE